ncbi:MAG TPA: hypothetical protein VEM96_04050 [Pyrinomonadaceae bacterium]|nr:hypothetical protein [Pyrinomonadaceae bacterium]
MKNNPRFPDIQFVIQTEEEAVRVTDENYGNIPLSVTDTINILLRVQYCHGSLEPISTDRGSFQVYCVGQYAQAIYTLLTAFRLWRQANYLETWVLIRHLFEVFIQMRYFERHPEQLAQHNTSQTRRGRIPFSTMFNEFSNNAYEQIYGFPLSRFAHGSANLLFRGEFAAPEITGSTKRMRPIMGCQFDERQAKSCYFFIANVALGLLNCYSIFFPRTTIADDSELQTRLEAIQRELQTQIDFVRSGSAANEFHAAMASLIAP